MSFKRRWDSARVIEIRESRSEVATWYQGWTEKGHVGTFWSDGNVLYFDWKDSYMGVYMCHKSLTVHLNLYHNKMQKHAVDEW